MNPESDELVPCPEGISTAPLSSIYHNNHQFDHSVDFMSRHGAVPYGLDSLLFRHLTQKMAYAPTSLLPARRVMN